MAKKMTPEEIIDRYFLEHRAKVLDIAAFLDRIDRAGDESKDFRITALLQSIKELESEKEGRTERILELLSDQSTEPIEHAGVKGASGAVPPTS
jgi:isopropylmalate/homocitrate/citramalate synthase